MPAFEITKDMAPLCSPTSSDDHSTPPASPNTYEENSPERNSPESATAPVRIPDLPPAPYFPMMHPYGYPQHPFSGFPYPPAMTYPPYAYPPSFRLPAPLTNLPYPHSEFNVEHKENLFYPAQDLSKPKHDDVGDSIFPLTRDRSNDSTSSSPRCTPRASNNDSLSPIPGRTQTTSFSSSDDTTKVSNTSLDSDKNYPSTPSPDLVPSKKGRTNYTPKQVRVLEKVFQENPYPDIDTVEELSHELNIPEKKLKNWFQNKRSRNKKKINETQQMTCSAPPPYFMPVPPHMMPSFSPFYPMPSQSLMMNSTMSPQSLIHRPGYPYPGSSPMTSLPGMMLPTQPFNLLHQHPSQQHSPLSQNIRPNLGM